jgi:hypothetical protein
MGTMSSIEVYFNLPLPPIAHMWIEQLWQPRQITWFFTLMLMLVTQFWMIMLKICPPHHKTVGNVHDGS